jgi:cellulose synthase/poly-beta-1,6-N-acetylglucosamine synthase-like glycosyltransferase
MDGFYGDDREITMYLKSKGYKVLVEETVTALTVPPKNFKGLVKQMMRWFRAGYYYYFKEMKERVARNPVYFYVLSYWYFLPLLVLTEDILAGSYFLIHFLRILNHVLAYHGSGIPLITDVFALRRALLVTAIHGLRLLRMEMGTIQVNTTVDVIDSLMELTVLSAMIYSLKVKVKDIIYPLLAFPLMFVTSIVALMSLLAREGLRRVNQG